jgi:hypothetical protein
MFRLIKVKGAFGYFQARQTPRVVDYGPYAIVRHPIYTGVALMPLGYALTCALHWVLTRFALIFRVQTLERSSPLRLRRYGCLAGTKDPNGRSLHRRHLKRTRLQAV